MTPLGPATIVGFEQFTPQGKQAPNADLDPEDTSRVCVFLDQPDNWLFSKEGSLPYIVRNQLSHLED